MGSTRVLKIGKRIGNASPPTYFGLNGERLQGALRYAHELWLDGITDAPAHEWLGLTLEEYDAWMRDDSLPKGRE